MILGRDPATTLEASGIVLSGGRRRSKHLNKSGRCSVRPREEEVLITFKIRIMS
jgi:hypothetical protein